MMIVDGATLSGARKGTGHAKRSTGVGFLGKMTGTDRITRQFVAFRIERTHARLTDQATKVLGDQCGLTPRQWWIITDIIAEQPETAAELTRIADIDKGQLSRNLKILVARGLVETRPDPKDNRQQLIDVTEAGRRLHDETLPLMQMRNERLLVDVDREDLETTLRVLETIEKAARVTTFDI